MDQILECLLARMNVTEERMEASLREMRTNQEEITANLVAKIEADNEKFEVLRGTLISRMDIY
jgi:hypothetical protein